jgi:hypothetical protein
VADSIVGDYTPDQAPFANQARPLGKICGCARELKRRSDFAEALGIFPGILMMKSGLQSKAQWQILGLSSIG